MSDRKGAARTRTAPRRPRRWSVRVGIAAAAVIGLYAVVGFFVVPRVVRSRIVEVARETLGREATVTDVRFQPFTLEAAIEGLELRDRDGAELFRCARVVADFQASSLFRWAWTFREILIERPEVVARILPDGRPSIADLVERTAEDRDGGEPSPIPRILIERLAVVDGSAQFVDQSRSPEFVERLGPLDLEVAQLTTIPDRGGDHRLTLAIGDQTNVHWSGQQQVEPLRLTGQIEANGIALARGWEWLRPAPDLEIVRGTTDLAIGYEVWRESDGSFHVRLADGSLTTRDLAVRPATGDQDWLTVPRAELHAVGLAWPDAIVEVGEVRVSGSSVVAWRDEDGRVNWLTVLESAPRERPPDEQDRADRSAAWAAHVGTVDVSGAAVRFEDRLKGSGVAFEITDAALRLENVSTDLARPVAVRGSATIDRTAKATFEGRAVPKPLAAELRVSLNGVSLVGIGAYVSPYLTQLPGVVFRDGVVSAEGTARLQGEAAPVLEFGGSATVTRLEIASRQGEGGRVACEELQANDVRVTAGPRAAHVGRVRLDGGYAKILIDDQGDLNLSQLTRAGENGSPDVGSVAQPVVPIEIGEIEVRDALVDFSDLSLFLNFSSRIHSVNGSIRDLSTVSAVPATVAIDGRVDETGYFKTEGELRVAEPFASTDLTVVFQDLALTNYTPYSAEFAGYAIERGMLDLDIHYRIADRRLVGDHRVVATDLTLGGKVEGTGSVNLPVRLAVALLKDKNGRIDLEVPVEGSVDSPEFAYRRVFWQACKQIMGNVAKAPFRAIGRLLGRDEEDLDLVGFVPGRSELRVPERDTLTRLAEEIGPRAELRLEIEGRFDPKADAEAIARERLEEKLDARRSAAEARAEATGLPVAEVAVEQLYTETFGSARLEQERARFQPPLPDTPAPAAPAAEFDAAGFYDALRGQLLEAQSVSDDDLEALGRARAEAIAAALTASGTLDAVRVGVKAPSAVKKKGERAQLVESEMALLAKGS